MVGRSNGHVGLSTSMVVLCLSRKLLRTVIMMTVVMTVVMTMVVLAFGFLFFFRNEDY